MTTIWVPPRLEHMMEGERERVRIVFSDDGNTQTVSWQWRPHDDQWLPLCDRTNTRHA